MEYVLDDKNFSEAMVDGITLVVGGKPEELTDDQVKRLKDAGAKVKEYHEDTPAPIATGRSSQ